MKSDAPLTKTKPLSDPEVALYGKDDMSPTNLEIVSLILLGSFLTLSIFLSASTVYYRRKVRSLLSKHPTPANQDQQHSHTNHTNNNSSAAVVVTNNGDGGVDGRWTIGRTSSKKSAVSADIERRPPLPFRGGHYRHSSADILIVDDTVVDRYDLHGVKIETDYSDCDTMLPNGTR